MSAGPSLAGAAEHWAELGLVLRATLLIGAAWAAAALLRQARAPAATRHMAWLLGIAALLALPFVWWLAPPLSLPILGPEESSAAASAMAPAADAAPLPAAGGPGSGIALLALYLTGVAALLLRFAQSRRLVARLWRDAEPAREAAWQEVLSGAARELGLSRPVALRIARGPAMPMTWGTFRPRILLPAEAGCWPADRRRLVLLHELAHVARRDSLSRSAASLACALYWFHPGAWFAARRLRLEQEYAADDRVLDAGAPARGYARSLLELALRVGGKSWPDHAAAMAGMCQLERRVLSITTPGSRERPGLAFLSASAAIATCIMLTVATSVPVRPLVAPSGPHALEAAPLESPANPAPSEAGSRPVLQGADRAILASPTGGPRDFRDGFQARRAETPPSPAEARPPEMAGQQLAPAGQSAEGAPPPASNAPAVPQRLAVYGPQLPPPLPEEQASDPRIPAALRRADRAPEGRARPAAARSRAGTALRVLALILETTGVLPQ